MGFWNYCPNCGKRLVPNEEYCSKCGAKTISKDNNEVYTFTPPVHNIGFFDVNIDFSPYINVNADFDYDICSCGYLNEIDNEFCYHCGVKRFEKGLSRLIRKVEKPKLDIDNIVVNRDIVCECGAINPYESEFCDMCGRKLHENEEDDNYSNFNLEFENPVFCFCGEENDEESQFCRNCGLPLRNYGRISDIKKLCVCSTLNDATSDFCIECGNSLNEEVIEIICVCGNRNPFNASYCQYCQRHLNPERILTTRIVCSCGEILDFDTEFCSHCGKNVRKLINRKKSFSKTVKSVKDIWNGI